jgi:glycosyltransferase involved in cell wall biosynthesis
MENKPRILHLGLCVNPPPMNGLQQAFINNSSEYREINPGVPDLNRQIVEMTKTFKPDIVFMQIQEAGKIHVNTIKDLLDKKAYIFNWNGDVRDSCPGWMMQLGPYVHSLFTNMRDVKAMRDVKLKADWLEIGYDPEIYCPHGHVNKDIKPIVFFGNNVHSFPMSDYRRKMCERMKKEFPGMFGQYGSNPGSDGNFNHSQREEAAAYRNAKIAINLSHYEIPKYTSDRMYRILGSGVMCLAKAYPGITEQFIDGTHLHIWNDLDELVSLTRYYLDRSDFRQKIAIGGYELARNNYTFEKMVLNLIELWKKETGN